MNGGETHHKQPIRAPKTAPPPVPTRTTSNDAIPATLRKQSNGNFNFFTFNTLLSRRF